jgi:hypothetical protein
MKVLNRFLHKENLPVCSFDIYFFAEVISEVFSDHELIQRILDEEDLEKYYF